MLFLGRVRVESEEADEVVAGSAKKAEAEMMMEG